MSSVHTFLSETAPTKYPRSPLPHPQRGWGTGRTVRSPEPAASARSPEASSLSPGLVFYRSRSLVFKEILFSFFSSSQAHHKYILVRGESYRSLPLCCPRWRMASCSAARNSGECWAALGCCLPAKVFHHWEGSCSVPRGSEQTEPWAVVSKYLGARQEELPVQQGHFWVFLMLCTVCPTLQSLSSAATLCQAGGHECCGVSRKGVPHLLQLVGGQWCLRCRQ